MGGRRLFCYNAPNTVNSVVLSVTPKLTASAPVLAYDLKKLHVNSSEWDAMPDGRLRAIQKGEGEDDITVFNVVLHWLDELRARMTHLADSGRTLRRFGVRPRFAAAPATGPATPLLSRRLGSFQRMEDRHPLRGPHTEASQLGCGFEAA